VIADLSVNRVLPADGRRVLATTRSDEGAPVSLAALPLAAHEGVIVRLS
jgi:hypothetical protein